VGEARQLCTAKLGSGLAAQARKGLRGRRWIGDLAILGAITGSLIAAAIRYLATASTERE
jgi:hypothetical protein